MAYYHHLTDDHRRKVRSNEYDRWEEEGTSYRKTGQKSSRKDEAQPAFRQGGRKTFHTHPGGSGRAKKPYADETSASDFSGDRRERNREKAFRNGERTAVRPGGKTDPVQPAEAADYRDYEYVRESPSEYSVNEPQDNLLTGRNPIREALKSDRDFEKLMVQRGELTGSAKEIVYMAKERRIQIQVVDKKRLDEIAPHHQGLVAFVSAYHYSTVEDILKTAEERHEPPFIIILDGITDPHNLGAIIRSAECAGAHGVIIPQHRSVGFTPAAVKASAGAVEHLKVARVTNLNRTIESLRLHGIWIYAVTMEGNDYETVDFREGTALVIGAEGQGISKLTAEKCDMAVSLPVRGHIDSLNASVAAGIMMYRVLACRKASGAK